MQTIKVDGGYVKVDTSQVSDDGWTDGLYACGSIEISSGTVDIISNRVGIFATGTGHPNPTTGIKITGGNIDVSAKLYGMCSGNNTYKKDVYIETTDTIDFKDSSIGIALANGNLTIKKGNIILKEGNQLYVNSKSNTQGTVTIEKADYTKVNEAKSKVPADLSVYTDESVKALQDTLAAVVEDKDVTEQIAVNGYATSIENAIVGLKYKPADYTKVNEAKAKVPSDLSIYADETVKTLKDALALVEEGKNITEQATVDGYAINKAIEGLVKKPIIYKVIEGEGGTFVKKSGKDISIRIDHEYTENVKVEVDGKEVSKTNYKVIKGSTIVTFNKEYLESLPVGNHEVKVYFEDGYATTTLIIKEQTKDNNEKKDTISNNQENVKAENNALAQDANWKNGDNTNIIGITLLLVGSLIVLIYLNKKKTA